MELEYSQLLFLQVSWKQSPVDIEELLSTLLYVLVVIKAAKAINVFQKWAVVEMAIVWKIREEFSGKECFRSDPRLSRTRQGKRIFRLFL